jgi:hypothetical protein
MTGGPAPDTRDFRICLWLIAAALALRAAMPVFAGAVAYDALFASPESGQAEYRDALRGHLLGYLWYNHVLPPLFTLKNGVLHNLLPASWVATTWYVVLIALDALTAALAYATMRRLAVPRPFAVLAAAAISLRLVPWETWAWGQGWDAFNPFLVTLFSWSMIRFVTAPSTQAAWTAGLSGALLVSGFQFGLAAVVAAGAGALILRAPARGTLRQGVGLLVLPLALAAALVGKNAAEHRLWAPSSGAGHNIIQNLNLALQDDEARGALKLGIREGYPAWWAWCYEEAERRKLHPTLNVAGIYGLCTMGRDGRRDYAALKAYLAAHPDPAIARVVEKDVAILRDRPWLWSGPVSISATGTSVEYGKVSQRLLFDVAREYPWNFFARTYYNLREFFLLQGYRFLVWTNRAAFPEPGAVRGANAAAGWLFLAGFAACIAYLAAAAWRRVVLWLRPAPERPADRRLWALGAVAAAAVAVALLSAAMSCCENHRHAFCFLPVLMCLAAAGITDAVRQILWITKARRFR